MSMTGLFLLVPIFPRHRLIIHGFKQQVAVHRLSHGKFFPLISFLADNRADCLLPALPLSLLKIVAPSSNSILVD
jgi:hypothetical protein